MAASRSTRVTRSTVGLNGLDENFCGRTLRNRSIAHPDDIPSHPLVRSKSPKKRPDPAQFPKGSNGGRSAELKQQSPRDSWVSPRKRGLSISEKDNAERDTVENCEARREDLGSPALKRIKRCLRSETLNSSEEESPINADQEASERKSSVSDNDADSPGTKQTRRCLLLDDCDEKEIKKVNACEEGLNDSAFVEGKKIANYETVNGIDEENVAALNCDDSQSDCNTNLNIADGSCSPNDHTIAENGNLCAYSFPLLSSGKEDPVLDHNVPCTNSQAQVELEDHKLANDCPPCEHDNQAVEPAAVPVAEVQLSVKYSVEKADVGNSSTSKEQCTENRNLNNDYDSASISGELETSGPDTVSGQITTFSEHQEHGYTLRTSPSRVTPVKGSPPRSNLPCSENGGTENTVIPTDKKVVESIGVSEAPVNSVDVTDTEKEVYCELEECADEDLAKPPLEEANLVSGCVPPVVESGSLQSVEDEEEEPDVYYFESDHVALKHNKDYQRLLQTIAVLEAQRTQAVQDLENLGRHQHEALKDPIGFVERLQKKVDVGLPNPQRVVQLPDISWDQYTTSLGNFEREFRNRKRHSRRVKLTFDKVGLPVRPKSPSEPTKHGESPSYSVLPLSDGPEGSANSQSQQVIRGRLCDESKPETFNQLWSIEEQKRLEQLLLKYPPEEVESRRWQKIADELGKRTAKQVASRVQKYFIKLTKAGIPVPGRTPNLYLYSKKSASKRQHPLNKHLFRPSTFMTSHEPPVYMDEDSLSSFHSRDLDAAAEDDVSDEENVPLACRELAEYKELLELKKLKKQKLLQIHVESGFVNHVGFKCDNCGTEPIQGVRWHCQDCPQQMSVDFCDSCSDCLHETATHKEDHHLEPVYRVETFLDRDYCMSQGTSYNYLDPNYFPANR